MTRWAFLGSGEFQPWHHDVDSALLADRPGRVLVVATASAADGESTYQGWREQGLAHYQRRGIDVGAPDLRRREDAFAEDMVAQLDDVALVFFSGGNPAYLASVLDGSPFWTSLAARLTSDRTAFAGCSAGVACLSDPTFDSTADDESSVWAPGLGFFPGTLFAPHWDAIDNWRPNARQFIADSIDTGGRLVALDENTAMVGDGVEWRVHGAGGVHTFAPVDSTWTHHPVGTTFTCPLPLRR